MPSQTSEMASWALTARLLALEGTNMAHVIALNIGIQCSVCRLSLPAFGEESAPSSRPHSSAPRCLQGIFSPPTQEAAPCLPRTLSP